MDRMGYPSLGLPHLLPFTTGLSTWVDSETPTPTACAGATRAGEFLPVFWLGKSRGKYRTSPQNVDFYINFPTVSFQDLYSKGCSDGI